MDDVIETALVVIVLAVCICERCISNSSLATIQPRQVDSRQGAYRYVGPYRVYSLTNFAAVEYTICGIG